jgi:PAS domain S-box-containing protein
MLAATYGLIWLLGLTGIGFGTRQVRHRFVERKRAAKLLGTHRARFESLLDLAPDAFIVMDEEHRIQLFSQGAANVFGYRPDEVIGERVEILMPPEYRDGHGEHVRRLDASSGTTQALGERGEFTGQRKCGATFPAEASIARLDLDGEALFTATLRDITERKVKDDALR